jgi:thioredoxin-like negative regulator of GroEL
MKFYLVIIAALFIIISTGCSAVQVEPAKIYKPKYKSTQKIPEFIKQATVSGKPTLLFFYANWDPTSSQVKPYIQSAQKQYNGKINLYQININDPKMAYLVAKFNTGYLPDTVILNAKGKTAMRIDGWIDLKTIQAGIEDALEGKSQE